MPARLGQRELDLPPVGGHEDHRPDRVRPEARNVDAEPLEMGERGGGQAVTAGLVAREGGLVDGHDVEAVTPGGDRRGGAGGPGADDEEVDSGRHEPTVPTSNGQISTLAL